jgi:hypothetical protein
MFLKFLIKPFDFTDTDARFYTNILSGEIGSGKTSFMVKYLYLLLINRHFLPPFKTIYVNVDGLDFLKFRELAAASGININFEWLDMNHFKQFAYAERKLYSEYNSDGEGSIAKRIASNIDDNYKKYIASLIICDEADHYMTKKDDEFANFLKFKRHHSIEIWFITQKFQNLHDSYYNSGAINRFLRVRSSLFNLGSTRVVQLWANSNTSKADNLVEQKSFEIESDIYDLYDSGAVLKTGNQAKNKLKYYALMMIAALLFAAFLFYFILGEYISGSEESVATPASITITRTVNGKRIQNRELVANVVRCVTFRDTSNCYFNGDFTSHDSKFITGLIDQNISSVSVVYTFGDTTYLSVDDRGLKFIFNQKTRGKNEKN